jgi:hypothetical protein
MEPPSSTEPPAPPPDEKRKIPSWQIGAFLLAALLYLIFSAPRSTNAPGEVMAPAVTKAQALGQVLAKYAADHDGKYPEGKTSTEIFQSLIDQGYLTDLSLLYYPMPGKIPATTKQLAPENVCWDMTGAVDANSPGDLPEVYSTGFNILYSLGSRPYSPPLPWWQGLTDHTYARDFMAICDHDGKAKSIFTGSTSELEFIPAELDLKGRTYVQLTPTGVIPPRTQ